MDKNTRIRKGILIILDGLGDRPSPLLAGRTPLEAAATPHLDQLAQRGMSGLISPLFPWLPVGTATGAGLLMGLAPAAARQLRRGPVQAAGVGLSVQAGDVALRANFAALRATENGFALVDRRAGRIIEDTAALAAAVSGFTFDGITFTCRAATQHRAVVLLQGVGLSDQVTDTDPGAGRAQEGVLHAAPLDAQNPEAIRTATAINAFTEACYTILDQHPINEKRQANGLIPANGLILRGAGSCHALLNIFKTFGLKVAVVAGESTILGLGQLFGFTPYTDPAFTAATDTDLSAKVQAVQAAQATHDLVILHIKAPDIYAHDLDPVGKKCILEKIDTALAPLMHPEVVLGVTGDHSTDAHTGRHSGDPVPAVLAVPGGRSVPAAGFGEQACQNGGLGHLSATAFIMALLDGLNITKNYRPSWQPLFW